MSVYFLEAIKCEKGDAGYNGSKPGDQLQKSAEGAEDFVGEVRMSEYRKFEKNGNYKIFRIKDEKQRQAFMEAAYFFVNSKKVGYSQPNRMSLYNKVKSMGYSHYKELNKDVEADCSSLMYTCAQLAGIKSWKSALCTADMMKALPNYPELEELTDKKYFSSDDYIIDGDIFVKNGHTATTKLIGSPTPEPTPEPEPPKPTPTPSVVPAPKKDTSLAGKYKNTTALNMRYGPSSANYEVEKVLAKGARVTCYGYCNSSETWILVIDSTGVTGWCSLKYLTRIT